MPLLRYLKVRLSYISAVDHRKAWQLGNNKRPKRVMCLLLWATWVELRLLINTPGARASTINAESDGVHMQV